MRVVTLAAAGVLIAVAAAGALYQFAGLRVTMTGAARPRLVFEPDGEARALEIARHRAAQRAAVEIAPLPAPAPVAEGAAAALAPVRDNDADATPAASAPEPVAAAAPYWTDLRGPARDGVYRERAVRDRWPDAGLPALWRQPVGGVYASFVIAEGRAFTIEQRGRQEVVAAYDESSGLELWTDAWDALFVEGMGGNGPRATPTWAAGYVYALGALGELRCLEAATGRVVWRKNILTDNGARNLEWGMAASPLIVGDTVVVLPGGPNGRSVVAYDRRTGARVWSALSEQPAYVSPMLVTIAGERQLLVVTASRMVGLAPDGGRELWSYPWATNFEINVAQPIVIDGSRVFLSSGYGIGAAVVEIVARGGVGEFDVREVWRNTRMKNKFTSSVLHDGVLYGLDESILAAVDADTGDLRWKGGRYGYGQILLAGDRLIVLTERGELVLVAATPERHEELARFPAIEGKSWNHLAMSGGRLLVRNAQEMAAFDLNIPGGSPHD